MKFIELTMLDKRSTFINVDLVSEVVPSTHGATVFFACCNAEGEQSHTLVTQTPEEILAMI